MNTIIRSLVIAALSIAGVALSENSARAQYYNPYAAYYQAQLAQQMWNAQVAQAYYGTGFASPYMRPVMPVNPTAAVDPYAGMVGNPLMSSTGAYAYGQGGYNSYANLYNPYLSSNSPGATLMGSADVMRAYGSVVTAQEQSRIMREQYYQAKLDTKKKAFDLEMHIKANTPTYTQEQERIAKSTLRRIQTNSLPGEIANGKALNFLLDDLHKYPNKRITFEPILLSEGVLIHLNVTKTTFGLSVIRDEGRVSWAPAVLDRMAPNQRKSLDARIQDLVKEAYKGRVDNNALNDIRNEIDKLREDLVKKVNEVPTSQYLDGKRFLQEFHEATIALERGEAVNHAKFQRFIEGGKSVQDVAEYLGTHGLRIGPATAAGEGAYRNVHAALASYDIAMNSQTGADKKE